MALINTVPPLTGSVDPLDQHLVQGDGRSVYRIKADEKSPGRTANEFWASHVLLLFREPGFTLAQFREWSWEPCANGTKTNAKKLYELRQKHPDLAEKVDEAIAELSP